MFFDPRVYAGISSAWLDQFHEMPNEQFFAKAPIAYDAQRELIELYTTRLDYLPDPANRPAALAEMSWEKFIRERMGLGDHAVRFANMYATDLLGLGCDAVSALEAYHIGPGFFGMGGGGFYDLGGGLRYGYAPQHRFPDGNHTIARHLLKAILPQAIPGRKSMAGVFNSRVNYAALDLPRNRVCARWPCASKILATKTAVALSFIMCCQRVASCVCVRTAPSCQPGAWRQNTL